MPNQVNVYIVPHFIGLWVENLVEIRSDPIVSQMIYMLYMFYMDDQEKDFSRVEVEKCRIPARSAWTN